MESSRERTRNTGSFTRDGSSTRALSRGLEVLRAFRPGLSALGNAEIAQRTGLPRATVSRLTRTLVEADFLHYDLVRGVYCLGPAVLTLSHVEREGSDILSIVKPVMERISQMHEINTSLATVDHGEMVYVETFRMSRFGVARHVSSGSRLPIAETALGRGWLAAIRPEEQAQTLARLALAYGPQWRGMWREIKRSLQDIAEQGWCSVSWTRGLVSLGAPLALADFRPHAFSVSFPAWSAAERKRGEIQCSDLLLEGLASIAQRVAALNERRG